MAKREKVHYSIQQAQRSHGEDIYKIICLANGFDPRESITGVFGREDWDQALRRFPEGQFVAIQHHDQQARVVGLALSLRTHHRPSEKPMGWRNMVGDLGLSNHQPEGAWLYGVEKAVHPDFQGQGIGSALYEAQFQLVRQHKLKGIFAGGMLKGFDRYRETMSLREYAGKVMRGEIFDPTVSIQMRKGFKPRTLIENYAWDHQADHTAMLIVWTPGEIRKGARLAASSSLHL